MTRSSAGSMGSRTARTCWAGSVATPRWAGADAGHRSRATDGSYRSRIRPVGGRPPGWGGRPHPHPTRHGRTRRDYAIAARFGADRSVDTGGTTARRSGAVLPRSSIASPNGEHGLQFGPDGSRECCGHRCEARTGGRTPGQDRPGPQPGTASAQPRLTVSLAFSVCASVGNVGVPSTVGSFSAAALSSVPSFSMASMRTGRA